ncbi:hypothetical protein V1478_014351, partial [Vespula squamosa]
RLALNYHPRTTTTMRMESVSHGGHSIDIDRNALIASLVPASPGPMSAAGNNDDVRRRKRGLSRNRYRKKYRALRWTKRMYVISSARLAVSKVPSKQSKALGTKQARNVGLCDRPQDLARNRFALAHCDNGL